MKKIIAITSLLAAGTLCANAEADLSNAACTSALAQALIDTNYQVGDAFELNIKIGSSHNFAADQSGSVLTLKGTAGPGLHASGTGFAEDISSDYWGIYTQAGNYIAIDSGAADDRLWTSPSRSGSTFTWQTSNGALLDSWVSYDSLGDRANPGIGNLGINVKYTGTTESGAGDVLITLQLSNGTTSIINAGGVALNANDLALGQRIPALAELGTFTANGVTSLIPEPSAFGLLAGLGALALAGTRRRRAKKA